MKTTWTMSAAVVAAMLAWGAPNASAALIIAGEVQTEQGDAADWSPSTSSLVMSDVGGGVFEYTLNNLVTGTQYLFKILNDQSNDGADWGNADDPEVTPNNNWVVGDSDGSAKIRVDTNVLIGDGGYASHFTQYQVGIESDNYTPQVVGSFQSEAGGADWTPSDPAFNMTAVGGGWWQYAAALTDAGTYDIKVTDGTGWDRQFGLDGYNDNAQSFQFATTMAGQNVIALFNPSTGAFSVSVPEPATLVLCGLALAPLALRRRR